MPYKDKEKQKEHRKQYYINNRDVAIATSRKRNKDKLIENRLWHQSYHAKNPHSRLIGSAKARAKIMGWEFNLTKEDLLFPEKCPYLDIEITYSGGKLDSSASIDRIDSSKGYIKGNVQIISYLANLMKSRATEEQLLTFAKNIIEQHKIKLGE